MVNFKKVIYLVLVFLSFGVGTSIWAQSDSMQVFRERDLQKIGLTFYNFAKTDKFNFEVIVLGGVRNPGIYFLPEGTSLIELVALTGGAADESLFDNFKLIRTKIKNPNLKADTVMVLSYKDFFDKDKKGGLSLKNPLLIPGDIVTFPIKPDKELWDYVQKITTIIVLPLIALATLYISILTYNK